MNAEQIPPGTWIECLPPPKGIAHNDDPEFPSPVCGLAIETGQRIDTNTGEIEETVRIVEVYRRQIRYHTLTADQIRPNVGPRLVNTRTVKSFLAHLTEDRTGVVRHLQAITVLGRIVEAAPPTRRRTRAR